MKISVFTPSNNVTHLGELYDSLDNQIHEDWEWSLLLNGDAKIEDLPEKILEDEERVRINTANLFEGARTIGSLKKEAISYCTGELYVEVDHDDMLTDDALHIIANAHKVNKADFYYTNFAEFHHDTYEPKSYDDIYGWESRDFKYNDKHFIEMVAFPINPSTMSDLTWLPNHTRVWSAESYKKLKGHNETVVADDMELLLRTFVYGGKFHHIDECLYLYRVHGDNQSIDNANEAIRQSVFELHNQYYFDVVKQWSKREDLKMLDLGGGHNSPAWMNLTTVDLKDADINCDISKKIPLEDDSCAYIRSSDFMEHIPNCGAGRGNACTHTEKDGCTVRVMNEAHRVLKEHGILEIFVPDARHAGYAQDPTHASPWVPNSFWYFTNQDYAKYVDGITARFQVDTLYNYYPSEWHEQNDILYVHARLRAVKDDKRFPGLVNI